MTSLSQVQCTVLQFWRMFLVQSKPKTVTKHKRDSKKTYMKNGN
jgi:hypothetical protein